MTTTAVSLRDDATTDIFYYLKIHGLPYYFFATIDPTSSQYGSDAWDLTLVDALYTAVQGLTVEGAPEQLMQSLLGGWCKHGSITMRLHDTNVASSSGPRPLLGQLFATGRAASSADVKLGYLSDDVASTSAPSIKARGADYASWAASGLIYVGQECFTYSSVATATGQATFTTSGRNRFPCHASFPRYGAHRVHRLGNGEIDDTLSPPVSSEPLAPEGRWCALYAGKMLPSGVPDTEANASCLFIGRINGLDYVAPEYQITATSFMDEIQGSKILPDSVSFPVAKSIYLGPKLWRQFVVGQETVAQTTGAITRDEYPITIDDGGDNVYPDIHAVLDQISAQLRAGVAPMSVGTEFGPDGKIRVFFFNRSYSSSSVTFYVRHGNEAVQTRKVKDAPDVPAQPGFLLTALGFPINVSRFNSDGAEDTASGTRLQINSIPAPQPAADVFIPLGNALDITVDAPATLVDDSFITDQGDGSGAAWVRFGSKYIVTITAVSSGVISIEKQLFDPSQLLNPAPERTGFGDQYFYYVPQGTPSIVEQVFVLGSASTLETPVDFVQALGQLLASNPGWTPTALTNYTLGLGLSALVDETSWSQPLAIPVRRHCIIGPETTFGELFDPIAVEFGLIAVWDPVDALIKVRRVRPPSADSENLVAAIDEKERWSESDGAPSRSSATRYKDNVHAGIDLQYGWDFVEGKFKGVRLQWTDKWVQSVYQIPPSKVIKIEDKTLFPDITGPSMVMGNILARSLFFRFPWMRITRSIGKRGIAISPGQVAQIVDNTIPHPVTGKVGITSADSIYALVTSVRPNLMTGRTDLELIVAGSDDPTRYRTWAPTALIDFTHTTGLFTRGYDSTNFIVRLLSHYTGRAGEFDGADFFVGQPVTFVSRNNPTGATAYSSNGTISAISSDGQEVTLTGAITNPLPSNTEIIMTTRVWSGAGAATQAAHAYQGDLNGAITGTTRNHKWM